MPFSLSLLPLGVIVAAVTAVAVVVAVLVDPALVALAAFVIALAVDTTMFLTVGAGLLIFDCCVPSLPEEDHCLPPPSGKVPSWPSSPSFVDYRRRRRRMTSPIPRHSFASAASWSHSLFVCFPPSHRKESDTKIEGIKLLKFALHIFWRVKMVYKSAYCTKFYSRVQKRGMRYKILACGQGLTHIVVSVLFTVES
jgi:hypothetical protein